MPGTARHRSCASRPPSRSSARGTTPCARRRRSASRTRSCPSTPRKYAGGATRRVLLGGALQRLNATVQPARLALGLRTRLLERGVGIHERTEVTRLREDGGVETRLRSRGCGLDRPRGQLPGRRASPATGSRSRSPRATSSSPSSSRTCSTSSAGGRRGDRRLPHARPLHADDRGRPHRLRLGRRRDGLGGRSSARLEVDREVVAGARERSSASSRSSAAARSRMRGEGRSTSPPPICRSSAAAAARTTASGSPGTAWGRRTWGGRSSPASRSTGATTDPARARRAGTALFPPEPLRYAGGAAIRRALLAKDAAEDAGRRPGVVTALVASLPRRLGLNLPR